MHQPRLAREIMVTHLVTLHPQMHVCDGLDRLLRHSISGAPVIDQERNYLGVFSEKCCMSVLTLGAQLSSGAEGAYLPPIRVKDFMVTRLVTLTPHMDVVEVIGQLLKHRISGAPVVDELGRFLGTLSERYSMRLLIDAAYDQLPTTEARSFMNTDLGRLVAEDADLVEVADIFRKTYYRRLVVLHDEKLAGLVCRRDVLHAGQHLAAVLRHSEQSLLEYSDRIERSDDSADLAHGRLPSLEVSAFMDTEARNITEETDLLAIAQIFLTTNHRRLPVLREGKLVGQVSRRDVMQATYDLMAVHPQRETNLLYLSGLVERNDAPISQ